MAAPALEKAINRASYTRRVDHPSRYSVSLTQPDDAYGLVVWLWIASNYYPSQDGGSCQPIYGGVNMTGHLAESGLPDYDDMRSEVWLLDDLSACSGSDLTFLTAKWTLTHMVAFWITAAGPIAYIPGSAHGTNSAQHSDSNAVHFDVDVSGGTGGDVLLFGLATTKGTGGSGLTTNYSGTELENVEYGGNPYWDRYGVAYWEPDRPYGTETIGMSSDVYDRCTFVGLAVEALKIVQEPDPIGFEWGVVSPGPSIVIPEDVTDYPMPLGMEWGVVSPGPKVRAGGARQVMLTGSGIETPEMTEAGATGQVLVFNASGTPTWSGTASIDHGGLTGLGDDDHPQYATIAEVIALLTPDWYTCDSMTVDNGTLSAGAHTDLHATGGTTVNISEVTGTPGIAVTLAFSGVDALTQWEVVGYYAGSSTHHVHIQLWNYDTSAWVTVATMETDTGARVYSGALADGSPYFDGSGNAQMRFYHDEPGNVSHDLYLDYVVVGHTEGGGAPTLALNDLSDVDAVAPNDGEVLAWDDYAGEWVPVSPGSPDLSAAALDDIGDVNAPAPDDGEVLTWSDGDSAWVATAPASGLPAVGDEGDVLTVVSGEWAAATPSGGPASTPPALRVYLYNAFK